MTPLELSKAFHTAAERGDLASMLDCYRPDAVLVQPDGRYAGIDHLEGYYRAQLEMFSQIRFSVAATHGGDDVEVTEWTFDAVNTGPIEIPGDDPLPATGSAVTLRGVDVLVVSDGRIGEHRFYWDQAEMMGQLGLLPGDDG